MLAYSEPEQFEAAVHDLVRRLGTRHTGFFHQSARRVPARLAVGVTCVKTDTAEGQRWIVRDVHEGGPGHAAGLRPCDVILSVDGRDVRPPGQLMLPMGASTMVMVAREAREEAIRIYWIHQSQHLTGTCRHRRLEGVGRSIRRGLTL